MNSYRPDAFRFGALDLRPFEPEPDDPRRRILRLSLRLFRPALTAQVRLTDRVPKQVFAAGVKGRVIERSGPWETSGEWWAPTAWAAVALHLKVRFWADRLVIAVKSETEVGYCTER
jgi:hypothetical protein